MDETVKKELDLIKESILNVVPAECIFLFGSYAYGTPNEHSDIDIYVVVPDGIGDLVEIRADIRLNLKKKRSRDLDLLMGRSSVFKRRKEGPTLERKIARDGVRLYG